MENYKTIENREGQTLTNVIMVQFILKIKNTS
jgi:hypothetical protein